MNKYQLDDNMMVKIADFYKTMSDVTRMKIVYALTKGELCVKEIAEIVKMSQTAVSYQLGILRAVRLVKFRREGKMIFYSIDDDHVDTIINTTIEHLNHL